MPVKPEEAEEDSADEEKPLVEEDIKVKYMKRLETLRSKRALGIISEDGSGWVSASDDPKRKSSMSEDQASDLSPPRKRRARNDMPSPKTEQQPDNLADDDLSPPRQRCKHDQSPPESKEKESRVSRVRAARHDTPSPASGEAAGAVDLSPPRCRQRDKRSISPEPERNSSRYDTKDLDMSPPRRVRGRASRHDSPSPEPTMEASGSGRVARDLSPPRRQRSYRRVSSPEPGRILSHAKAKDVDLSPPRRGRCVANNDAGASSPKDLSPPRKRKNDGSGSSISTKRSHRSFDENEVDDTAPSVSDLSPPRRRRKNSPVSLHRPKTGLVTSGEIKAEIDKKRMEDLLRFKDMDPSVSGRDAEAVYRNKVTGERMSKVEYLQLKNKEKARMRSLRKLRWSGAKVWFRRGKLKLGCMSSKQRRTNSLLEAEMIRTLTQCLRKGLDGAILWHIWSRKRITSQFFQTWVRARQCRNQGSSFPRKSQITAGSKDDSKLHQIDTGSDLEDTGMVWIVIMDTRRNCLKGPTRNERTSWKHISGLWLT